ncbi:Tautomerase/MIF superfamily [Paraphoma chrysanthemicola]|nr:Tautomerase/MIF superfamily [Paraphoma chrysanthemicola]
MSRPSSTSTNSGNNAFPKQAGAQLLSPEAVGDQLSPAASQFSFASSPRSVQESEQLANDGSRHLRPITRGTTGDVLGELRPLTSRSRAQFYEDSFSYKDGTSSSARERVTKDAPIVAELRTNVIIKDEYTLVTDLSHHLSTRYQRPETSIMITVNHSACLLLGGSFEPTYVLAINALPVQLQPTTNKRNAALIQQFMCESIGVTPDRGIIKFIPIPEESLAMNGMTILGEIERLERQQAEENGGMKRAMTKSSRKSAVSKAKSSIQLSRNSSKANTAIRTEQPSSFPSDGRDSGVAVDETVLDPAIVHKMSEKKSEPLMSKFAKRSNSNAQLTPPPIPKDKSAPQVSKRKSFMSVFRR